MNKFFRSVFLLAFIGVMIFVVLTYVGYFSKSYATYEAEMGELKYEVENKGFLIYNEDIIAAPESGEVVYLVNNNQRIQGKTPIAKIKPKEVDVDRDIKYDGKHLLIDIDKVKNNIKTIENQIAFFRKEKDVEAEEKAKGLLENLYPILDSLDGREDLYYNEPIESYDTDKKTGELVIYSSSAGIVSLKTSPIDQLFTPDNMYILKYHKIDDYEQADIKKEVQKNEGFIRVVDNSKVFLFTNVDKEESLIFQGDKRIDIEVNGTIVKGVLFNRITNSDSVTLQFLLLNDFDNFTDKKVVDIKMTPASEKGIIIDESSIIEYEGVEGVEVLNKDNTIIFKRINRLTTVNGKVCISVDSFSYFDKNKDIVNVDTVMLYDDIIKDPKEEYLLEQ